MGQTRHDTAGARRPAPGRRNGGMPTDRALPRIIQTKALERIRLGERPSSVVASYAGHGFHPSTLYRWIRKAGLDDAHDGGYAPAPAWTAKRDRQLLRWINGKTPPQYGLDGGLWTRRSAGGLVARYYRGESMPAGTLERLLDALGLPPLPPIAPALPRGDAWAPWSDMDLAAIARLAGQERAELGFWCHLPCFGEGGNPIPLSDNRQADILGAVAVRGAGNAAFWFASHAGALTGRRVAALLHGLLAHRTQPLHLVLDHHPAYREPIVHNYVRNRGGRLRLHYAAP